MNIVGQLKEKVTQYVDVYVKLAKISFIGKTANLLSHFMFSLIALFIFLCIILFLGFGLTELFVVAGLSKAVSFFITIGIYVLLLVLVVLLRRPIARFFASIFIKVLTEGDDDKEADEKSD